MHEEVVTILKLLGSDHSSVLQVGRVTRFAGARFFNQPCSRDSVSTDSLTTAPLMEPVDQLCVYRAQPEDRCDCVATNGDNNGSIKFRWADIKTRSQFPDR